MTSQNAGELDFLGHLARESARFAEAVGTVPPGTPVPTCPDWTADDLLWHLAEVQWFWGTILRESVTTDDQVATLQANRPSERPSPREFYASVSSELSELLAATAPDTPAWTWAEDRTAGFIRRRQAHEALIHRIDAELTANSRTPMDGQLSADGVDEALRIMYGGGPEWASFTPHDAGTIRVLASDTGHTWLVTPGRFTGAEPGGQASHDEEGIQIAVSDPGTDAAATISGTAADLDCWLWHRPPVGQIDRSGDSGALAALEKVLAPGIN